MVSHRNVGHLVFVEVNRNSRVAERCLGRNVYYACEFSLAYQCVDSAVVYGKHRKVFFGKLSVTERSETFSSYSNELL